MLLTPYNRQNIWFPHLEVAFFVSELQWVILIKIISLHKPFIFQFDPSKELAVFARIAYDANGERLSIVEEVDIKKERKFYEFILLHREVKY